MEVRRSIPERTALSVATLIVESGDRALVPASVAVIVDTMLETATEQRSGWR